MYVDDRWIKQYGQMRGVFGRYFFMQSFHAVIINVQDM